MTKYKVIAK